MPWESDQGLVGHPIQEELRKSLACPIVLDPYETSKPELKHELVGSPVHSRCWDLLTQLKVGKYWKGRLGPIPCALRQRCQEEPDIWAAMWERPDHNTIQQEVNVESAQTYFVLVALIAKHTTSGPPDLVRMGPV
ncbi:hypothetical protein EYZ11_000504 [Aspergillus tanneri]|uniref:Uncharacterized protein n=1 Tax=Aspergillus tanneri TaxID=1220188 RepID=A0A4S3JX12_9EURO|nr:hypothetical protein EYZ11_000504 [Aspergillus tanneri]